MALFDLSLRNFTEQLRWLLPQPWISDGRGLAGLSMVEHQATNDGGQWPTDDGT